MLPRSRRRCRACSSRRVVARVQADGRLVEDVQHAGQAAADLADARRMRWASPPESVGAWPAERQVVEADVDQELAAGCVISRSTSPATCCSAFVSFRSWKSASVSPSG